MKKTGQISGIMTSIMVTLLVTVIVLGIVASFISVNSSTTETNNEAVTITTGSGQLANDNLVSFDSLVNSTYSDVTGECNVTLTTGELTCNTTGIVTNTCYANYTYYPDGFIKSSMTRTIVNYLPIMLALSLFIFIGGYIALRK